MTKKTDLSWQMRQTLKQVKDHGPSQHFYESSLAPLYRRGLVTKPRLVRVMVEVMRWEVEMTPEGRAAKYRNTPEGEL